MALTLLQLVSQASSEMGIQAPATVISNTTLYVIQMLNLANGLGQNLTREHDWNRQDIIYNFPTVYYQYTATTVSGSTTISAMSSTTGLTTSPTYFSVMGTGIAQSTMLVSVNSGASTAVLNIPATASGTVTLTFAQTQYDFATGFDRLLDRTQWSKTQRWELLGPETPQQWEWLLSSYIATGPRIRWRVLQNGFQIWPPQAANINLGYEYMSQYWVVAAMGTTATKAAFTADTDTSIWPDSLLVSGLKWRWTTAKTNNPNNEYKPEYDRQLSIAKAADGGSPTLAMSPMPSSVLITWNNIPDSGIGL